MRAAVDGYRQQRGALALRKIGNHAERFTDRFALFKDRVGTHRPVGCFDQFAVIGFGSVHGVQGSVMDYAIEPRPQIADLGSGGKRRPGA